MNYYGSTQFVNEAGLRKHMLRTFMWMFVGVLVTFGVAYFISNDWRLMYTIYTNNVLYLVMLVAQFGVVIALSARLMKMKENTAKGLFLAYSVLTGITFASLFIVFSMRALVYAFLMAALFFGSLVAIGLTTKADLSKIGTICYAGLFAVVIYSLLGMLFGWSMDSMWYSIIGLVLFMGITAWDTQKAKHLYIAYEGDTVMVNKLGIYAAFQLYLDFLNIFLYILRFVGDND